MRHDHGVADDELLDVLDEAGVRSGVKARADVHRDGDWHVAFHLWVVGAGGVLLQRRASGKASWPGRLDATAAGHLVAGERVADGLREAEEELGVAWAFGDLVPLGVHRVEDSERPGVVNRELQHVFGVRDDRPLHAYDRFDRTELDGLVLVDHPGFAALAAGRAAAVDALAWDGERVRRTTVRAVELVPSPYLGSLAGALAAL
jgi:isopentenyldiphosphate isomerase